MITEKDLEFARLVCEGLEGKKARVQLDNSAEGESVLQFNFSSFELCWVSDEPEDFTVIEVVPEYGDYNTPPTADAVDVCKKKNFNDAFRALLEAHYKAAIDHTMGDVGQEMYWIEEREA